MNANDYQRNWRARNPDKVRAYNRSKNSLLKHREWAKSHRKERNEIAKRYYRNNREELLGAVKVYRNSPERQLKTKWIVYRSAAKRCKRSFDLSFEIFEALIGGFCWYCGKPGPGGIDRLDSSLGYSLTNVVSCCFICNGMKSKMNEEEFIDACKAIVRKQMAQFKITIVDTEDGRVKVESEPHMSKLAEMARNKDLTPAAGYALGALAKIIKDSQLQTQEEVKAKFDAGLITPQVSNRRMFH